MKFTENAVKYFKKELNKMNLDTVEIKVSTSCCVDGYGVHVGYLNSNSNLFIDGIKVKYEGPDDVFSTLEIDIKGEMIIFN